MKERAKQFLSEKKELLIFVGVLVLVFTAVMIISGITLKDDSDTPVDVDPIITNDTEVDGSSNNDGSKVDSTLPIEQVEIYYGLPVDEEVSIIRVYYSLDKSDEELQTAVIFNGSFAYESTGLTYYFNDEAFNVYSVFDGTVTGISKSDAYGTIVEVTHEDNIVSYYSSLSNVSVSLNDEIKKGDLIGVAGMNSFDSEASVHLSFEVKVNGIYVDPEDVIGKTSAEVSMLITDNEEK